RQGGRSAAGWGTPPPAGAHAGWRGAPGSVGSWPPPAFTPRGASYAGFAVHGLLSGGGLLEWRVVAAHLLLAPPRPPPRVAVPPLFALRRRQLVELDDRLDRVLPTRQDVTDVLGREPPGDQRADLLGPAGVELPEIGDRLIERGRARVDRPVEQLVSQHQVAH